MGYTHYFTFKNVKGPKGTAKVVEATYQKAIADCQRIVRRYYAENGELSGYTAHTPIGAYGGLQVNGKRPDDCESFDLREHFSQNFDGALGFNFVKTRRLPYDLVVTACLAVLKHRLGDAIEVTSDGNAQDWSDGVEYARKVTRLAIANPIQTDTCEACGQSL